MYEDDVREASTQTLAVEMQDVGVQTESCHLDDRLGAQRGMGEKSKVEGCDFDDRSAAQSGMGEECKVEGCDFDDRLAVRSGMSEEQVHKAMNCDLGDLGEPCLPKLADYEGKKVVSIPAEVKELAALVRRQFSQQ